ncbi:ADP-glyceromanno-heptose 6-epimerase [Butyrivibrio fibrisolvens]|uniref:ADP-glyceromanno-heptose 6-epimerase n=1 Tax=Butyrivibrio fibrisolvens TaxID=831 RepID=UPI0003F7FF78|nr:ADP-glyceromanno-heptose 6-epimerase [Butyrivibrio fibrisolvens]
MIIVTGGAGFIGSCIVRTLNDMGIEDIVIVDHVCETDKWMNMRNKKYLEYINRDDFLDRLHEFSEKVTHIIHMGACSATTERNFDFLYKNNFEYTKTLWKFCADEGISFIYASSAATYGDGNQGFDDKSDISLLRPLNGYGYSKQLFDLWVKKQLELKEKTPKQHVGFKFFNVYGPNEYFKGTMASVIFHTFNDVTKTGKKGLFKSYKEGYEDGGQLRDFVYVKDICKVVKFMVENPEVNGLFNLGTGKARSFYDLAVATFNAMGKEPKIEFIEMPEQLRGKYQYFTQAEMSKLRDAGYKEEFYSLEDGARDYVQNYLMKGNEVY